MQTDPSISRVPTISAPEGAALFLQQALLGTARAELVWARSKELPSPSTLSLAVRSVAARHRAVSALSYLYEQGGVRERTVLRNGHRIKGRLWDRALNDRFTFTHTDAGEQLWFQLLRALPSFGEPGTLNKDTEKRLRKLARDCIPATDGPGDWVVYTLFLQQLELFRFPQIVLDEFSQRIRLRSPVALLFELGRDPADTDFKPRIEQLVHPRAVRILECIDNALLPSWTSVLKPTWARMLVADNVISRWQSAARLLTTLLETLDRNQRLDLSRVVMLYADIVVNQLLSGPPASLRANISTIPGINTIADRDRVSQAFLSLLGVVTQLFRYHGVMASERYGDDRYEEAQLFLRYSTELLLPLRARTEELTRVLSGTIG